MDFVLQIHNANIPYPQAALKLSGVTSSGIP